MPQYSSRHYSRSRWSGWSAFSLRLVGSLVVFAVAALSGAVIGGVSIYLINDAATVPPSAGLNTSSAPVLSDGATTPTMAGQQAAQQAPGATDGRPVRMIDPASPPPSSAQPQSPPPSAAASQPTPQDNSQTTAGDAVIPDTATHDAATTHDAAAQTAAPETGDQTDVHTDLPRKTAVARKRATNARRQGLQPGAQQATDQAQSTTRRAYYDYYDRDNDQPETATREHVGRKETGDFPLTQSP